MPVFFNGRKYITPTSASVLDDTGMFNRNLSVGNVLALIGRSSGGQPFVPLTFGSTKDADLAGLVGEELKAVEKAFDPSAETAGPSQVVFVRINPATQSILTLKDNSGNNAIDLKSTDYGLKTTGIRIKVDNGTMVGKRITTQLGNTYYSADNLARNALRIGYTGPEIAATVTIAATSMTITAGAQNTAIDLTQFPTIQQLSDRIAAIPNFTSTVMDGNGQQAALNGLDFVTAQDVKTAPVVLTAHLQAAIDWLNSTAEGLVDAARSLNAGAPPANIAFTYLAGGSDGMVTNNEWQQAFDALQNVDVQWVVPISPLPSIWAMCDTHVAFMSGVGKKERRALCGMPAGSTDASAIAAANALNSDRTSLAHLGFYDYDATGNLVLFPAYVLAALLGGMFSGVNPGTALTNKSIKVRGLERNLRNPIDTDLLIQGGVLCVEKTNTGFKVVKSISTWITNTNYNRVEQSVGVACDFVLRNVREAVDGVRGKKGNPLTITEALSRAEAALRELARPEPIGPGVLAGDKDNPPYRKLTASLEGDVIRLEYECSPVIPVNYILQVAHAVPYSGSASA